MATIPEHRPQLDYEEQLARIARMRLESDKFAAEMRKLSAEALKLDRDRTLAPWVIATSLVAASLAATIVAVVNHFLR